MRLESLDGCFGLPRKKAAGSSARKPLHGISIFGSQEEVDTFVETYPTQPKLPKVITELWSEMQVERQKLMVQP